MAKKFVLIGAPENYPKFYDIDNPPLIMEGFTTQAVTAGSPISREQFEMTVNRGAVTGFDYMQATTSDIAAPMNEFLWNDSNVTLLAGGQELIRDALAARFTFNADIGNQQEQKIKTRVGGGQVVESTLQFPTGSLSTTANSAVTLLAYYATLKNDQWKEQFVWNGGLGLKSRSYKLTQAAAPGTYTIADTLPKNNGEIVGFSLIYEGADIGSGRTTMSVDGLQMIKNVPVTRFSRFSQRDPHRMLVRLDPGSRFDLELIMDALTINAGVLTLTFYFNN